MKLVKDLSIDLDEEYILFKAVEFRFGLFLDIQEEKHKQADGIPYVHKIS
jgi:hypothetical protein